MFNKNDELFFPPPINVDLTISRCKKKLATLRRYIRSTSHIRGHTDARYFIREKDNIINTNKQKILPKNNQYEDLEYHFNDEKIPFKNYEQNEIKKNVESKVYPEFDSESSLSYNNSFVNALIERYQSESKTKFADLNNKLEAHSSLKVSNNRHSPDLSELKAKEEVTNLRNALDNDRIASSNNKLIANSYRPNFAKDCKGHVSIEKLEKPEQSQIKDFSQHDSETKEIVENLDKKIRNLERSIGKYNRRKVKQKNWSHHPQSVISEYLEWSNHIESKLLSISVMPPNGIFCYESSFLPYYCTIQEMQIVKDLISIKGKIINSSKAIIEVTNIGKLFCCYARNRFITSIKELHHTSPNILKLKLLVYLDEPETLLVNTFGPHPIENESDINFYELEALYETSHITRFLIKGLRNK
ncbi:hypothetical protein OJ253_1615 [Cryptosporidium canis]|uniref:Uncharacterized protein n=1 Tax=Cryptosporidium canis TaxID=195482 RepID=A0A9D5HXJ6_9CRYT|nr:hypothetical protein OJ253_1615 [Cryptosporidium canis]